MNKKKAVYTSLTALALASFSATTFADEVAETAVAETTVALADEAVAEDTAAEASPEVAATETVAEEEPVAVTALVEEESNFDKSAIQEQFEAGDTSYIAGTWEKEVTEYDTIPHTISISTDSRVTSIAYPKGYSHDFSRITGSTSTNGIVDENTVLISSGGVSGTFKRVSAEETVFEDIWSWTGLETYDASPLSDDEFVSALMSDPEFRNKLSGIFVEFKGTHEGTPYHLVYNYDTTGKEEFAYQMNTATSDIFSLVNLPEGTQPVGLGSGPRRFMYVLPDGVIPTLKTQEVVAETTPVKTDISDINAQIREGNTQAIAGTWQTETGELISISADNKLFSITYPEGHRLDPSGRGESVELARLTEAGNLLLPNLGLGVYAPNLSLTKLSDEETTFDKTYWAWTGLENYTYDWSVNSLQLGMEAGEKGGHYHIFSGDYEGVPYQLVYFRDTTNEGSPKWSDFNLPADIELVGRGSGPNIYYYVLLSGYIPVLKSDVSETITLTDDKNSGVTVELSSDEGAISLDVTEHIEPTEVNPAPIARLEGLDYDLYDITLKDADGNPITTLKAAAIVKLPVDEGKTVERVIYLPETGDAETLAILKQEDGFVYFEASHFSHYGVVYALVTSPAEETKDVATTRNELLLTLDASGLTDAQKSDLAEKIAFAETAEELANLQAEFDALLQAVMTTPKADSKPTQPLSRTARAQEEKAAKSGKTLPQTGEKTSLIGLVGLGLLALGAVGQKRRNI